MTHLHTSSLGACRAASTQRATADQPTPSALQGIGKVQVIIVVVIIIIVIIIVVIIIWFGA